MELIPILSAIILVATIATFLLAIGAYVLYKVREKNPAYAAGVQQETIEGELISPLEQSSDRYDPYYEQASYADENYQKIPMDLTRNFAARQTQRGSMRTAPGEYPQRTAVRQNLNMTNSESEGGRRRPMGDDFRKTLNATNSKFLKYTMEGYAPVEKTKTKENLRWR